MIRRCIHQKSPMGDLGGRFLISAVWNRIVHLREKRINKVLIPVIRFSTKVQMFESVPRTLNWLYFFYFYKWIGALHQIQKTFTMIRRCIHQKSPMGDLGGRFLISAVWNRIVHLREKRINKVLFPVIRITTKVQMFESVPRTLNWLYFLFLQMNRCAAPNTKNIHYDQTLHSPKVPLGGFRGPLPYFCGFKPHCA